MEDVRTVLRRTNKVKKQTKTHNLIVAEPELGAKLSYEEKVLIKKLHHKGRNTSEIAKMIGRPRPTVAKEIKRYQNGYEPETEKVFEDKLHEKAAVIRGKNLKGQSMIFEEREVIEGYLSVGYNASQISTLLGRSSLMIGNEIRKCKEKYTAVEAEKLSKTIRRQGQRKVASKEVERNMNSKVLQKQTLISFEERKVIEALRNEGMSGYRIAKILGRSQNTILNEIRRCKDRYSAREAEANAKKTNDPKSRIIAVQDKKNANLKKVKEYMLNQRNPLAVTYHEVMELTGVQKSTAIKYTKEVQNELVSEL
ncbi:MAG: helix-turn-helix domain-containing protein [Lachnospiraceae bacterium]